MILPYNGGEVPRGEGLWGCEAPSPRGPPPPEPVFHLGLTRRITYSVSCPSPGGTLSEGRCSGRSTVL